MTDDADDLIPAGATTLATLTLIRMPSGAARIALVDVAPALREELLHGRSLLDYTRQLVLDATRTWKREPLPPSQWQHEYERTVDP